MIKRNEPGSMKKFKIFPKFLNLFLKIEKTLDFDYFSKFLSHKCYNSKIKQNEKILTKFKVEKNESHMIRNCRKISCEQRKNFPVKNFFFHRNLFEKATE